jgi:serine-type D-Ala-D-Ala carboxypeptidase/endopeptidase (penicillin-binding protein 4)
MKKLLLLCLIFTINIFPQESLQSVISKIDTAVSTSFLNSTTMAVDVYDLTAHENIYKRNEQTLLHPASNMKVFTTSAGLVFLDPDYNFTTSVKHTGKISNGILNGDLYVVGGCDPDFNTGDIDSLVAKVKAAGIKEISGNLYGDVSMMDTLFWGEGWMWDDDPSTDAPYLTPLDINANSIGVKVIKTIPGEKAKVLLVPQTNFMKVINNTLTVPKDSSNTYSLDRDWMHRKNTLIVKGNIKNVDVPDSMKRTLRVNVFRPDLYFLTLMKEHLASAGIKLDGNIDTSTSPASALSIYDFKRPYDSVIVHLNKVSYNLGAEMTMYALAAKCFGKPATAHNGTKMVDSLISLSGLDPKDYKIVDGSGVSRYDLVSAESVLSILKYMYYAKPDLYKILYKSFPIAGVDGTLEDRMIQTPAQNNVHAKTGTLSGVACLSGYLTAKNGHELAFSMLTQNYVGSAIFARGFQDIICNILVSY